MASLMQRLKARRRMRLRKAGRDRKTQLSQKSTQSYEELFAGFGEPGQALGSAPKSE